MKVSDVIRIVHKVTAGTRAKVNTMITRVVVDAINDGTGFQTITVDALAEELLDKAEHMQPGGVSHVSTKGAEGVIVCVGGSRTIPIVLGLANRSERPKGLLPGETAIYTVGPFGGTKVLCKADGNVEVTPGGAAPKATVIGDAIVTGEVTAKDGELTGVSLSTHLTPSPFGPLGPPTPGT